MVEVANGGGHKSYHHKFVDGWEWFYDIGIGILYGFNYFMATESDFRVSDLRIDKKMMMIMGSGCYEKKKIKWIKGYFGVILSKCIFDFWWITNIMEKNYIISP